jgi:hypothetical protein
MGIRMNNPELILMALEQLARVRPEGKGWRTRCPNPNHEDRHPSFFLYPGGGGRCYSQCDCHWPPQELAQLLGISLPGEHQGLTLPELAQAKGLPEESLRVWGVKDGFSGIGRNRKPCVDIPFVDAHGELVAVHKRLSLHVDPRFVWRRGDRSTLYGLSLLTEIRRAGKVILVEGETDTWTLWFHKLPALGLPGSSTWREEYSSLLQGLEVFLWHEPDAAGDGLIRAVAADLPDVKVLEPPHGVKDFSEAYLLDPAGFKDLADSLMHKATPMSLVRAEALSAEARECLAVARPLLNDLNLMQGLREVIASLGYAGDPRPAIITFVAIISRLLERPINLAYISPSSAGKNAAVEATLPIFPEGAYYLVRASSPRALIYNEQQFQHRVVVLTEADSLPEEGPAASAIRSLMSDQEMSYEVVEKGKDGEFHVRKISKPGPTGLITTSTRPLGDQASTRTLTVNISDSPQQTRLVLHAQADRTNHTLNPPDLSPLTALDRWLELAGERRVVVPFAHALADLVPATAVRMRRDFAQLLAVVQVMALLHQCQRDRDSQGRIVASLDDYAESRWLLEDVFDVTVSEGLTPAVRQTVEAVSKLSMSGHPVTEQQLTAELGLSKSAVSYRVKRALQGGWLVNLNTQRGAAAQLLPGAPIPDGHPLPTVEELLVCVDDPSNASNRSNGHHQPATDQLRPDRSNPDSNSIRTDVENVEPFEPGSKECSNGQPDTNQLGPFEEFEPFPGGSTHTKDSASGPPSELPWDRFLDEREEDGPDAG